MHFLSFYNFALKYPSQKEKENQLFLLKIKKNSTLNNPRFSPSLRYDSSLRKSTKPHNHSNLVAISFVPIIFKCQLRIIFFQKKK